MSNYTFRSGSKFTAIEQVAWYGKSNSDSLIILLGGVPIHSDNHERNLVTVVRGSNVSMLELDYKIIAMEAIIKVALVNNMSSNDGFRAPGLARTSRLNR